MLENMIFLYKLGVVNINENIILLEVFSQRHLIFHSKKTLLIASTVARAGNYLKICQKLSSYVGGEEGGEIVRISQIIRTEVRRGGN